MLSWYSGSNPLD